MGIFEDIRNTSIPVTGQAATLPMSSTSQRAGGASEDVARSIVEKRREESAEAAKPVEVGPEGVRLPGVGARKDSEPQTFSGRKITEYLNPDGTASDGVLSSYTVQMFRKKLTELQWSSKAYFAVAGWLSFWTARNWSYNTKSSAPYLKNFISWLNLDWKGRTLLEATRLRWFASGKAKMEFQKGEEPGAGKEGPE